MSKKPLYRKKKFIIIAAVILGLVILRLLLPTIVKNYVNKTLSNIPDYYGHVDDIDISLWRGAYVIHGLYINKTDSGTQVPFINLARTDISVQWKSLLEGRIVSEIELDTPQVIYVFEDHEAASDTEMDDWTEAITDIVPVSINRLAITNGKLAFVQVVPDPSIDLHIYDLNGEATNLQNVIDKNIKLPSAFKIDGKSIGEGDLNIDGKLNLLKVIPDMDISVSLENADITSMNEFFEEYAKLNFEKGKLNVYSEIAIADGYLKSYVKPMLKESKLIGPDDNFFEKLWEGFVGFFKFVLKNQKTDNVATKIPIEGDLNDSSVDVWTTVFNLIKNAWFEAFQGGTDDNIEYKDAESSAENE